MVQIAKTIPLDGRLQAGRGEERITIYGQHGVLHAELVVVTEGVVIPDMDPVFDQILNIRIATEKPQQFVDDTLQEDLLGGQQRESLLQVKAHLVAEDTLRAGAGAVSAHHTLLFDATQQVEVLFHKSSFLRVKLPSLSNTA